MAPGRKNVRAAWNKDNLWNSRFFGALTMSLDETFSSKVKWLLTLRPTVHFLLLARDLFFSVGAVENLWYIIMFSRIERRSDLHLFHSLTKGSYYILISTQFSYYNNIPGRGGGGGVYSEFQKMEMIKWGQRSKPPKIPRTSNKTPKNPIPNFIRLFWTANKIPT